MAAVTAQSLSAASLTTPSAITPSASDTVLAAQFGANGLICRVITSGTATTVTVSDPGATALGNAGTPASLVCPSTGDRMFRIPATAISPSAGYATINFSGALTGVTYELYQV